MKTLFLFLIILSFSFFGKSQTTTQTVNIQPLPIGEQVQFKSTILSEVRLLNVYLPEGYSKDSAKVYPVIYVLDGSMNEDFIHITGLVQFGSFPWINMLPQSIVVGISNIDRKRDFTFPSNNLKDKAQFPTTGASSLFIKCIEKEIQPLIENEYKTSGQKTIIGQSLGGLLATEILISKPALFNHYIIVSPSLWWDNTSLLQKNIIVPKSDIKVYIASGKEGYKMKKNAKQFYKRIKGKQHINSHFEYLKEYNHANILHKAVYKAFKLGF